MVGIWVLGLLVKQPDECAIVEQRYRAILVFLWKENDMTYDPSGKEQQ